MLRTMTRRGSQGARPCGASVESPTSISNPPRVAQLLFRSAVEEFAVELAWQVCREMWPGEELLSAGEPGRA
jgi:hypothetical protein